MGSWFKKRGPGLVTPRQIQFTLQTAAGEGGPAVCDARVVVSTDALSFQQGGVDDHGRIAFLVDQNKPFHLSVIADGYEPYEVNVAGLVASLIWTAALTRVVPSVPPEPKALRRTGVVHGDHRAFADAGQEEKP